MPGLCGFVGDVARGGEPSAERLRILLDGLRQHPNHRALPGFSDARLAAGLVLRQPGRGGLHWRGRAGLQVWVDGEAFTETGLMPAEQLAAELAKDAPPILNGTFSAVVYDPARGEIRFITDPYGLRHLYVRLDGAPAWSGDLPALLKMPGGPPALRRDATREFLEHGHFTGEGTWLEDVHLLEPGVVLRYNLNSRQWFRRRYFELEKQEPSGRPPSFETATQELGELFRCAVERRSLDGSRIGLTLSGGLDSRAILAALPQSLPAPQTLTFGTPGCADQILAVASCKVRRTPHAFTPLGGGDWLAAREPWVRLTNGQVNILHLHGMESLPVLEARMDVSLNGFLGDALLGGSYLDGDVPFFSRYLDRGRRLILQALHAGGTSLAYRLPFLDEPLLRYALSLPRPWLRGSRIYRAMLLREFPEYFRGIPWEHTGLPISASRVRERLTGLLRRGRRLADRALGRTPPRAGFADYASWLRQDAALEFLRGRLDAPDTILAVFLPSGRIRELLESHARGADESEMIGRCLTAEIWLRFLRAEAPGSLNLPSRGPSP